MMIPELFKKLNIYMFFPYEVMCAL